MFTLFLFQELHELCDQYHPVFDEVIEKHISVKLPDKNKFVIYMVQSKVAKKNFTCVC